MTHICINHLITKIRVLFRKKKRIFRATRQLFANVSYDFDQK